MPVNQRDEHRTCSKTKEARGGHLCGPGGSTVGRPSPSTSSTSRSIDIVDDIKSQPLHKFFTATENIDLQFADRAEVHHITHPSHDLMDIFHRLNAQRRLEAGLTPTPTHADSTTRIVGLTNPPMHCLGLVLHAITNVGIQTFVEGDYQEVHLTLMETEFVATGPQFLVNLFNKIMLHEDNNAEGKQKAVETIRFTREFIYAVFCSCNNISSSISMSGIITSICRIILISLQEYGPTKTTSIRTG